MLTESQGRQFENGVYFYPGVTSIAARSTDLPLNNVGFHHWVDNNPDPDDYVRAMVKDPITGEETPSVAPVDLALDGTRSVAGHTTITYRYLEEKP